MGHGWLTSSNLCCLAEMQWHKAKHDILPYAWVSMLVCYMIDRLSATHSLNNFLYRLLINNNTTRISWRSAQKGKAPFFPFKLPSSLLSFLPLFNLAFPFLSLPSFLHFLSCPSSGGPWIQLRCLGKHSSFPVGVTDIFRRYIHSF